MLVLDIFLSYNTCNNLREYIQKDNILKKKIAVQKKANADVFHEPGAELKSLFYKNPLMATVKLSRFKFVSKMLSSEDIVLDVGCGSGMSSHFFSKFSKKVIGVDNTDNYLSYWNEIKSKNLKFIQSDIFNLKLENAENINAIVALDFIEHFNLIEGKKMIQDFAEILNKREGGIFICGTPSKFSQTYRAEHNKKHHLYEYEPEELKALCRKHFNRVFLFSMNDEMVHTGFEKLAWYIFVVCVV